jgi:hypothetical protein
MVSVGVIRVVVVGGGGGALLGAELDCCILEGLLEGAGLEKELVRERLMLVVCEEELWGSVAGMIGKPLVVCEEEVCGFVAGMVGKLVDNGELEEVMRVVLESDELLDSGIKLEENVELSDELRLGDELGTGGLLVVEKKTSLLDDK